MRSFRNGAALGLVLLASPVLAQQNPPSEVIARLTIHPERISVGNGDNWPITWADDGNQYTVYCDGEGFGGGSGKGSMSIARIVGKPPNLQGKNLSSPTGHKTGGGPKGRKASGLLMVGGVLYMWVRNLTEAGTGSSLAWSMDRATDPGHCYRPEVVFNPGIGKYLLLTATSGAPRWAGTDEKYLGVFEASTPWGPWHTVKQIHGWGDEDNRFQPRIPPKWISDDGKSFYLLHSCFPKGPYQFNLQKCVLEMSEK